MLTAEKNSSKELKLLNILRGNFQQKQSKKQPLNRKRSLRKSCMEMTGKMRNIVLR